MFFNALSISTPLYLIHAACQGVFSQSHKELLANNINLSTATIIHVNTV